MQNVTRINAYVRQRPLDQPRVRINAEAPLNVSNNDVNLSNDF